ncbi:hypothetical protein NDU88_000083, partial [Pleurodeles waltl]
QCKLLSQTQTRCSTHSSASFCHKHRPGAAHTAVQASATHTDQVQHIQQCKLLPHTQTRCSTYSSASFCHKRRP